MRAILAIVVIAISADAVAGDWPNWRGPDGNGISHETGWKWDWSDGEPEIVWNAEVGTGFSSLAVSGGKVFTTGHDGEAGVTVFCLDAETGKTLWTHHYEAPLDDKFYEGGPTSTPTVFDGEVFVLAKRGKLICLGAENGAAKWEVDVVEATGLPLPGWGFSGSVVVEGDLLLVNVGKAGVALKRADGAVVWASGEGESGYTTPVRLADSGLALFSSGKGFAAVEIATGETAWEYRWVTRYGVNASDPIVSGNHVFLSSGYGKGCVLLDVSGDAPKEVWKSRVMRTQMNPCVLVDGYLYGTDGDEGSKAALKCIELASGQELWSEPAIGTGGVMVAGGKLLVLSARGELIVAPVSSEGFEPSLRMQVLGGKCWTVPVLANGRVYCRNADGKIACVDIRGN